jgi:hypothetical protein
MAEPERYCVAGRLQPRSPGVAHVPAGHAVTVTFGSRLEVHADTADCHD